MRDSKEKEEDKKLDPGAWGSTTDLFSLISDESGRRREEDDNEQGTEEGIFFIHSSGQASLASSILGYLGSPGSLPNVIFLEIGN